MWEYIGHPPCNRQCEVHTVDGNIYRAVWVDRINKYVNCNRWRRTDSGLTKKERFIDDDQVIEWRLV